MTKGLCSFSYLIDISNIDDIAITIKVEEHLIKIDHVINFDLIFDQINRGTSLSGIIKESRNNIEKYIIMRVLEYTNGNKSKSAKILKINYKTLYYKIKKYCLQ
jgi:transcriptional regulator with PAS, ATPase and Fis domain